jgi:predicted dehydrogenase
MAAMADFRVGVLGCGQVSHHHFLAWQRCKGATVVAACDPNAERAKSRAEEFKISKFYSDPAEMVMVEKLDLIDIITPRETHADLVRLACSNGIHAICEKPLCPTLADAKALVAEIGDKIRLMVNENWRYRPYYRLIGSWLEQGRLGKIVHYRIALKRANMLRNAQGVVPALARQPFMAKEHRLLIAECLIHDIDVTRSLMGEMTVIASRIARGSDDVIGEDVASILMETEKGVPAAVDGVLCAAGHDIRAGNRIEITGTRCSVLLDNAIVKLFGAEEEEHVFDEAEMRQKCFDLSIQHFVDGVRSGKPFWTSAQDQLATLKLVEDSYEMAGKMRLHA